MRLLTDWLSEFTTIPDRTGPLADRLTDIGLEVDEVLRLDRAIENVVTARVVEAEYHPDRRDWTICHIESDGREARVVTAAPGVRPNQTYLWAPPGARIPEMDVESEEFRGVSSEGMLCSSRELGLTEEAQTLLRVPDEIPTGRPAVEVLDLRHPILELDLTPNRSDCLSHLGVARDFAAAEDQSLNDPRPESLPDGPPSDWEIRIDSPEDCWAYTGAEVTGVVVDDAEFSVQKRILKMGYRPLNNLVDLTNYALFEVGHPLHPFDGDKLHSPVVVRRASSGETLETLDGQQRELSTGDLVIADEEAPRALAGVMGGTSTQVDVSTDHLLLEAAYFDPGRIRSAASRHKLRTEASHRFERGTDEKQFDRCLARCLELIEQDPAQVQDELTVHRPVQAREKTAEPVRISLREDRFEELIGYGLSAEDKSSRLKRLGIDLEAENGAWECTPPSWRTDLHRPEDLVEEIVRLDGYENIPVSYPSLTIERTPTPEEDPEEDLRSFLAASGFHETLNFSFVGPSAHPFSDEGELRTLDNPLSRTRSTMRQSLLGGLLQTLERNVETGYEDLRLFGRVFPGAQRVEPLHLGLIATGRLHESEWHEQGRLFDFYDLKGLIQAMLARLGYESIDVTPGQQTGFKHERTGRIEVNGSHVGGLGEVQPELVEARIEQPVWAGELDLSSLPPIPTPRYETFSTQPVIKRDLDLVVDRDQTVGPMRRCIREEARWLQNLQIFDVYTGDPLPEDKKSVSFTLYFQAPERTLSDREANQVQERILDALRDQFGAYLRDE